MTARVAGLSPTIRDIVAQPAQGPSSRMLGYGRDCRAAFLAVLRCEHGYTVGVAVVAGHAPNGSEDQRTQYPAATWTLPCVIYVLNEAHIPIGPPALASIFILDMMRLAHRGSGSEPAMVIDKGGQ